MSSFLDNHPGQNLSAGEIWCSEDRAHRGEATFLYMAAFSRVAIGISVRSGTFATPLETSFFSLLSQSLSYAQSIRPKQDQGKNWQDLEKRTRGASRYVGGERC